MKKLFFAVPIIAVILAGAGCAGSTSSEQQTVIETHKKQIAAVPLPALDNSLERTNISKRLTTFDEPNKVSYVYLVNYGKVMAFYTIKGKVTSGSKRLTQQEVAIDGCGNQREIGNDTTSCTGGGTVEAPELDGTYGSSNPYIYFWTTDNVYVQWSGDYMLVDQPLQLSTPPEMVRTIK